MTDANAAPPPRFVFALFGRRRAGKSVLLAALRAVRRPQVSGVRISYVGALAPILRDNTEPVDDTERKRIEAAYLEASDALSDGRVPVQTAIADGIMGHRFELTLPSPPSPGASVRLHVDIYDYAGELLAITQDDQTAINTLHNVLRDTDGLLILAETPMKGVDPAAHRESLSGVSALGEALSRLGAEGRGELSQAVLLATKWDHQHIFDCERADQEPIASYLQRLAAEEQRHASLFADWLTTDPAAEQHHLLDTRLRAIFGTESYRSYPVSAFGKARFVDIGAVDGSQAEVPAVVPLASLNLDEPILFLVEQARAHQRRDLLAKSEGSAEAIGPLPDRASLVALHGEDTELLSLREELALRLEQLALDRDARATHERRSRMRRNVGLALVSAAAVAGGAIWFDAHRTLQTETAVQDLVNTAFARNQLESVISARDALFDLATQRGMLPTTRILGLGYPPEQQTTDLAELTATECKLWADRAKKPGFDVEQGRVRLETLPGCGALDGALRAAHLAEWKSKLLSGIDDFGRLTAEATCSAPDFVESSITEMRNKLIAHLEVAPAEAKEEGGKAREKIDRLEAECKKAQASALRAANLANWRNVHRSALEEFKRLTDEKTCTAPDFVESSVTEMRNKLIAHLEAAPEEAKAEGNKAREKIYRLEAECKKTHASADEARAQAAAQKMREDELKTLDFADLQRGKWADYIKGVVEFSKERPGAPSGDAAARLAEAKGRLEGLEPKLQAWGKTFAIDGKYSPAIGVVLETTKDQINGLPKSLEEQKEQLLKAVAEIQANLQIWEACSAFRDVYAIYTDISGNLGSRTEVRVMELRDGISALRRNAKIADYLHDSLEEMEQQIPAVSKVLVKSITLEGQLPGGSNADITRSWALGSTTGGGSFTSHRVGEDARYHVQFNPNVLLTDGDVELFVTFAQGRNSMKWNYDHALKTTLNRNNLLTGTSGVKVTKELTGTLYQTDGPVTSSTFSTLTNTRYSPVKVTLLLTGEQGPRFLPPACQVNQVGSAKNAPDL
jgi:hypothetical protein